MAAIGNIFGGLWDVIAGMGEGFIAMVIIGVVGLAFGAVLVSPGLLRDWIRERRHRRRLDERRRRASERGHS